MRLVPEKKNIELIVYDFDGTLFDTKVDIAHAVNLTLAELGLPQLKPESLFTFIGNGVGPLLTRALEGTGYDNLPQAMDVFRKRYEEHLTDHTRFYPQCRETVEHFMRKRQAIYSNKPEYFIRKILDEFGFLHPFAAIVGGDTLSHKKPEPEGLFFIMKAQNISADATLMVGDSPIDIKTGKRAGVATCAVTYGLGERSVIEKAKPDYMVDNIAELQQMFC